MAKQGCAQCTLVGLNTPERKENRIKVTRFLYKVKNKSVVQTFKTWQEMLFEVKRHRNMVARAAGNGNRTMGSAYDAWYEHVQTIRKHRFLVQRAACDGSKGQCLLHTRVGMNCATGKRIKTILRSLNSSNRSASYEAG